MIEGMDEQPEVPTELEASETSPLRAVMTEIHEIYQELKYVGFPDAAANDIVAHLVLSVVHSRNEIGFADIAVSFDEDDFDDEEDDDIDDDDDRVG